LDEQKATSQLLALQSVADKTEQRRTVLLLAARLLNANTASDYTGGPAARLLNILLAEDLRSGDDGLRSLIRSQEFMDLVTAEYTKDYDNDNLSRDSQFWSTLNGDEPITHEAKLAVLVQLSAPTFEGWAHVATFSTSYRFPRARTHAMRSAAPSIAIQVEKPQAPIGAKAAHDFLASINEVNRNHSMQAAKDLLAQYAIAPVAARGGKAPDLAPLPLFRRTDLMADSLPVKLIVLRPRLLRNRAPLEYVNPDGSFQKGSLGTVIGALAPGACVEVLEPLHPVLVFVTQPMSSYVPGPKSDGWIGLIHVWAHVHASSGCGFTPVVRDWTSAPDTPRSPWAAWRNPL
jgi:hypothetical protein